MKFKTVKGEDYKSLSVKDYSGDVVTFETVGSDAIYRGKKPALFVYVNEGNNVAISRAKALKLAWAIIDELSPSSL